MTKKLRLPAWHETPFQHMRYTLVTNQEQLDKLLLKMASKPKLFEFLEGGASARVNFLPDDSAIVQISNQTDWTINQIHSLLTHEAMHIWQEIKKRMGEENPSVEFEAYSIQLITQDLFYLYDWSLGYD
ncbi:hypothetical protein [Acinetobacter sp. Ver3]|uniref:hypothetical protein n=1 Tax=Acinetobacter sp. Ver3 TaxID=466088 RepID=UPI000449DF7B|nr:hypothetical protein [Acinetobacter sp. Ver3]EZQ10741.1 hypothetical protein CL42_06305 [Acinetobacter sp. Ver3]